MSNYKIEEILKPKEMTLAVQLYAKYGSCRHYIDRIVDLIIEPNLDRINRTIGQEIKPVNLAYVLEFAIRQEHAKQRGEKG